MMIVGIVAGNGVAAVIAWCIVTMALLVLCLATALVDTYSPRDRFVLRELSGPGDQKSAWMVWGDSGTRLALAAESGIRFGALRKTFARVRPDALSLWTMSVDRTRAVLVCDLTRSHMQRIESGTACIASASDSAPAVLVHTDGLRAAGDAPLALVAKTRAFSVRGQETDEFLHALAVLRL